MNNKTLVLVFLSVLMMSIITGCRKEIEVEDHLGGPDYNRPLGPGQYALRKVTDPARMPDFTEAAYDLKDLRESINNSLSYLAKASSKTHFPVAGIEHQRVVDSLNEFGSLLDDGVIGERLNQAIRTKFDVYESVGCDDAGTVLFTGYYTPIFDGSKKRSIKYQYPLYKLPAGHKKDIEGNTLTTYPGRKGIESSGMFSGNELFWLADPFEVYIAHVQGSAKIRMPDGKLVGVGYAGNNGHEYNGISKAMLDDGVIARSQLSLSAMIAYFKHNPNQVAYYTGRNPRFVFFREQSGNPRGSLNEPVTTMRSIATDKSIFPRAGLTFISTHLPQVLSTGGTITRKYTGFMMDQDTGGAIRAPGRCDVYMGIGDEAGQLAGQIYQEGRLYYLLLK